MIRPISPAEATPASRIPDFVIEVVNKLIVSEISHEGRAVVKQDDIIDELLRLGHAVSRAQPYEMKWLDFEGLYREVGWNVVYDKADYYENYPSTFTFKKPR